ncbi:MAG TPA: ABC transporter permease [Chryseosolibacter sp.]
MFRNILTITLRNFQRQFLYSFINILGLAVGMACSLVIFLYVYGEWSHDRHIKNGDRIYRIGISFFSMGEFAIGSELIGEYLPRAFDGVAALTQFQNDPGGQFTIGTETFRETVFHADSNFFKVFSREAVQGNLASALQRPNSIVLTESMARKFFNSVDVLGKTVEVGKEKTPHEVTAIIKDDVRNSHLKANIWTSFALDPNQKYVWSSASMYNYVLLHEKFSHADLRKAIDQIVANDIFPAADFGHKKLEEYIADPNSIKLHITPLREIYLRSKVNFELTPGGNETNMIIFSIIAGFIVVLAAVNFINLSTARAARRAKEVGIRKSLGTSRGKLVLQFLFESVMISFLSLVIALGLAELFTFTFFWITGQTLTIDLWNPIGILIVVGFALVLGVSAGLYPAFYLTRFQPVKVLKGNFAGSGSSGFRNGLVIFQFAISICLIICTTVIISQFRFMSTKDLGFDQQNVFTINNMQLMSNAFTLRDELLNHPDVVSASMHAGEPGSKNVISYSAFQTDWMEQALSMFTYFGDENFQKVMGFRLIEGRWFDANLTSDSAAIILNESAVRALGITGKALGTKLNKEFTVIGVVSDFHWESLRKDIGPVAFQYENAKPRRIYPLSQLGIKVRSAKAASVLDFCRARWKERVPDEPMQFQFVDQNFGDLLVKEQVFGKAIAFFTVLAIFISCLGLFGLSAYTAEQRTKEIGIRKALGASVSNIILMLNRQFALLVLIATLVAVPVSYFAIGGWLNQFAYKIDLQVWMYVVGALLAMIISLATVAFHSLRASRTNPAETLKCD